MVLAFSHDHDELRNHVLLLHAVDGALSNVLTQPRPASPLGSKEPRNFLLGLRPHHPHFPPQASPRGSQLQQQHIIH
jgi:hypothetical protein